MPFAFDFSDMLVNTATIKRSADSKDAAGRRTNQSNRTTLFSNLPCSIQALGGAKLEFAVKMQWDVDYIAYFDQVYAIALKDNLTDENGVVYEIRHAEDQGGTGEVWSIMLKKITN